MAKTLNQGPFLGVPAGKVYTEEPDGCTYDGVNALRDTHKRPEQYNPDQPRRPTFPEPKDPL